MISHHFFCDSLLCSDNFQCHQKLRPYQHHQLPIPATATAAIMHHDRVPWSLMPLNAAILIRTLLLHRDLGSTGSSCWGSLAPRQELWSSHPLSHSTMPQKDMTARFQATTQNDASSTDACGWNNDDHSHQ